jgi:hypothetical protein
MRDLFVTSYTPTLDGGRGLRTYGVVAAMARHRPVDVLYQLFDRPHPAAAYAALRNVALCRVEAGRGRERVLAVAGARLRGAPLSLARAVSPELVERAERTAAGAGRVVADGPTAAAALLPLARRRPVVYLAHNLESAFRGTPQLARFERTVLETFAESWLPTEADIEGARRMVPGVLTRHVRNVVDVAALPVAAPPPGGGDVLLVADYRYEPNRAGLAYLVDEVMPRLWEREPEARLVLAGRGLENPPSGERIEHLGFVDDLDAVYARAAVAAVPMPHGGGSPLKLIEALARGVPVVATAHAAGLVEDAVAGEHLVAAGDAGAFADGLARGLRGELAPLAQHARALAERHYSIEALAEEVAP